MRKTSVFQNVSKGIALSLSALAIIFSASPAFAVTSLSDLRKQQAEYQRQAAAAASQAQKQKDLAARAALRIQQVTGQIASVTESIQSTQQQITTVQAQVAQKDQDVAALESSLREISDQVSAFLRQLYILSRSEPEDLSMFSNEPVSERIQRQEQLTSLKKAASAAYIKTVAARDQVMQARADLQKQNDELITLRLNQENQKEILGDAKETQAALRSNAAAAEAQYEAKAAAAQAAAAKIAEKIRILTQTSKWGDQIVSSNDSSWYYTQTGNYTRMGNSYYTVNDVGCLITSIAMIATYYGRRITPTYIAENGTFSNGYLVSLPGGLGITKQGSRPVNWGVVNDEISHGRPVILSIYLSSVGAVNSDGSSHFIVVKGFQDGKYLMHDPIGAGRGYNLNQVRSMVLVSKN